MTLEEIKKAFEKEVELNLNGGIENPLLFYMIKDKRIDMKNITYDKLETLIPILEGFEQEQDKENLITPIFKRIGIEE